MGGNVAQLIECLCSVQGALDDNLSKKNKLGMLVHPVIIALES